MSEVAHGDITIEKKVKTIYRFHRLVFDRGNSSRKCFNRATQNYGLWQPAPVRYRTRRKRYVPRSDLDLRHLLSEK